MWVHEHTETTTATPAQLWAHYAEPASWPRWDHEAAEVTVDGPLAVGTRGTFKPVRGPSAHFTFTDVSPHVGFTNVTRLPLARLAVTHRLESTAGGSRLTHGVSLRGPLSPLFVRVVGRKIAAGLPTAMRKLAELAEAGPPVLAGDGHPSRTRVD